MRSSRAATALGASRLRVQAPAATPAVAHYSGALLSIRGAAQTPRPHGHGALATAALCLGAGLRRRRWLSPGLVACAAGGAGVATATATSPTVQEDYDELAGKLKEISALGGVSGLLGWDEMTMMPPGAAESRGAQKAALAGVIYVKETDPSIGALLERLQGAELDAHQKATVREAARSYRKATALSEALVKREAELESKGYHAWIEAKKAKDWSLFAPVMKEWVQARRERAKLIDASRPPYDVLADDYSAGLTAARIREVFDEVRRGLVPLLAELRERGTPPAAEWLKGDFDTAKQAALCHEVALAIGFDTDKGRLDVSEHPFTGGSHPCDVRMTTRFKADDLTEGLTGAIHETGHALYEQGRSLEYDGLPVNVAAGMAVHESQSLLWERMVALSRPFAAYLLPKLREAFPGAFPDDKTAEDLYGALNVVREKPMIRVEADEVTYPMHIILRFEIESGLIEGSIEVEDVPKIWNAKMQEYLGITPANDAEGCLQDVHWSAGLAGYFPTYSLGAMMAVQLFAAAEKDLPNLSESLQQGDFKPLRGWLLEKVHKVGSLHPTADDLLVAVTGKPLEPALFLNYLRKKYTELYKLPSATSRL